MESLVVLYHTPFDIFHSFFLHMHPSLRIYRSSFLLALHHCIVSMVPHMKYIILIYYMRDTRWPTPPASGGIGSSPLRSETNAAYILVKRAISSNETDGLVFFSTRRRCWSQISCFGRSSTTMTFESVREPPRRCEAAATIWRNRRSAVICSARDLTVLLLF